MVILILDCSNVSDERIPSSWKEQFADIHRLIINLNLFKYPYNDDHGRRNEIIATRIYVLLMIVAAIIIAFSTLITEHTYTYHVG